MYIMPALGVRGLFFSRNPMEHHAHPIMETTGKSYGMENVDTIPVVGDMNFS
jgi:hypothetical protein